MARQLENTGFLKELQRKETSSKDEFMGALLQDQNMKQDHIAVKSNSSSKTSEAVRRVRQTKQIVPPNQKAPLDPEVYTELSVNLWKRLNAGYLVPKKPVKGSTHSTYTYDPNMVEKMNMEFHRKRDFYSEYNEAAARFKLVLGNKKPLSKSPKRGQSPSPPPNPSAAAPTPTAPTQDAPPPS